MRTDEKTLLSVSCAASGKELPISTTLVSGPPLRTRRRAVLSSLLSALLLFAPGGRLQAESAEFLSDATAGISMRHQQQWGDFGLNTAAARPGTTGSPLRIGQQTFPKGLGHHANGEIVIGLNGQYNAFLASVGVQWQGGHKGSVIFRIAVDGKIAFESGRMSDSDPARPVQVSLANARELRLIAADGGDGIGCDMANWAEARLVRDPRVPFFGTATLLFNGRPAPAPSAAVCGFSVIARESGPQVAVMKPAGMLTVSVRRNETVRFVIPFRTSAGSTRISAEASVIRGAQGEVELSMGGKQVNRRVRQGDRIELETEPVAGGGETTITVTTRGMGEETGVRWRQLRYQQEGRSIDVPLALATPTEQFPPPVLPDPRPAIEQELIEWDWRMQDGIGTPREPRTWAEAVQSTLRSGDDLISHLAAAKVPLQDLVGKWEAFRTEWQALSSVAATDESRWEDLWRRVHVLRRRIAFQNPLANVGPLVFARQVPGSFSHQLTQYYGMCARPGGGVYVLDAPGVSMQSRRLGTLPPGSFQHPEVSWDGRRVLFSYCDAATAPGSRGGHQDRHYNLFEMAADGSKLRQLTSGPYDDFSPRYLPDGRILFVSTRRGGYHRCGRGPCPVYTMATANADGSNIRVISYHETHEWDPAVLNDGRIIYTRWDYVDRHAVHYQQLWSVRPDGSDVRAFYGNNTFNPVGVWEARPVPGSSRVMATAAAHHAMTAGSIILLDVTKGIEGLDPITRLTPDALFPESEFPVAKWHAPVGVPTPPLVPSGEKRWPGHCYRTPYPLSEDFFLAAYSFDALIGEPNANPANMFGLYLVDRFGNKELLFRDVNIASLWPTPLRARRTPPAVASTVEATDRDEGTFFLQNVNESWPELPTGKQDTIKRLRVLQVLPKTTPNANDPKVGLANASPGKQVLGTVPVEPDGSAYFRVPAGIPLSFQALDDQGMAVQTMRSLTYLQRGEQATCIGCHEHRAQSPATRAPALAAQRPPSTITAGPVGSKPFSYPILVQPVLDRLCVRCHGGEKIEGKIDLTGTPAGHFTVSYNALAPLVPYSEWKGGPSFPKANSEPATRPGFFGARASKLMALLRKGHEGVKLTDADAERLITWMDANALFYGTFDPADQKRQQLGQLIAGPALE